MKIQIYLKLLYVTHVLIRRMNPDDEEIWLLHSTCGKFRIHLPHLYFMWILVSFFITILSISFQGQRFFSFKLLTFNTLQEILCKLNPHQTGLMVLTNFTAKNNAIQKWTEHCSGQYIKINLVMPFSFIAPYFSKNCSICVTLT